MQLKSAKKAETDMQMEIVVTGFVAISAAVAARHKTIEILLLSVNN